MVEVAFVSFKQSLLILLVFPILLRNPVAHIFHLSILLLHQSGREHLGLIYCLNVFVKALNVLFEHSEHHDQQGLKLIAKVLELATQGYDIYELRLRNVLISIKLAYLESQQLLAIRVELALKLKIG